MNFGSPLRKDQKEIKIKEVIPKQKFPISLGTTKKVLNDKNLGTSDMIWLNNYIENKVQGECLPKSLFTNNLPSEIISIYGHQGSEEFLTKVRSAFASIKYSGMAQMQINPL
jgi:hypothetical protein